MNKPFTFSLIFLRNNYLFIYVWLCWVFVAAQAFSLVAASRVHVAPTASHCRALARPPALQADSLSRSHQGSLV